MSKINIDLNKPLTKKQLEMLEEMEAAPITYDEDCPELSEEELATFGRPNSGVCVER